MAPRKPFNLRRTARAALEPTITMFPPSMAFRVAQHHSSSTLFGPSQSSVPIKIAGSGLRPSDDGAKSNSNNPSNTASQLDSGLSDRSVGFTGNGNDGNECHIQRTAAGNSVAQGQPLSATSKLLLMFASLNKGSSIFNTANSISATGDNVSQPSDAKIPEMSVFSRSQPRLEEARLQPPDSSQCIFVPLLQANPEGEVGDRLRFCHLSFMEAFESFSPEEVRVADYQRGNRSNITTPLSQHRLKRLCVRADSPNPLISVGSGETASVTKAQSVFPVGSPILQSPLLGSAPKFPLGSLPQREATVNGSSNEQTQQPEPSKNMCGYQKQQQTAAGPSHGASERQQQPLTSMYDHSSKQQRNRGFCLNCGEHTSTWLSTCRYHNGKPKNPESLINS